MGRSDIDVEREAAVVAAMVAVRDDAVALRKAKAALEAEAEAVAAAKRDMTVLMRQQQEEAEKRKTKGGRDVAVLLQRYAELEQNLEAISAETKGEARLEEAVRCAEVYSVSPISF